MQLHSRDGIACDLCGTTYRSDFMYYSWDFRLINVHNDHKQPLNQCLKQQIVFSFDVCAACYSNLTKKVITNNTAIQSEKRRQFKGTLDELTGAILKGTYSYYYCDVSKITVKMTGQPNVCVGCNHATYDDDKKCSKCGGLEFIVPADMTIEKRILEVSMAESTYTNLQEKAKNIRKVAGEWATKT